MVEDIKKKSGDLERVKVLSHDLQCALNVSPDYLHLFFCNKKKKQPVQVFNEC